MGNLFALKVKAAFFKESQMRIGIVADIHEAIEPLQRALAEFRSHGVDQVVSLGDACDPLLKEDRASEVVELLQKCRAIGVWGNHDFSLCGEANNANLQRYSPEVLNYMATMMGHLVLEDCRFSHVEPWLDANSLECLWYYEGHPDTPAKAQRSFQTFPERCFFIGHHHRWLIMSPDGEVPWNGREPLQLNRNSRYLMVMAAVCRGWCAIYDTSNSILIPIQCSDQGSAQK
jgi:hypothetical protein